MSIELGTGSTENKVAALARYVSDMSGGVLLPVQFSSNSDGGLEMESKLYDALGVKCETERYTPFRKVPHSKVSLAGLSKLYPQAKSGEVVTLFLYVDFDMAVKGNPALTNGYNPSLDGMGYSAMMPYFQPTYNGSSRHKVSGFMAVRLTPTGNAANPHPELTTQTTVQWNPSGLNGGSGTIMLMGEVLTPADDTPNYGYQTGSPY